MLVLKSSQSMAVNHGALWLVTNLRHSAEERNFISDNQHISGKIFKREFYRLQLMCVCDHI
jgi:hypothetical protein